MKLREALRIKKAVRFYTAMIRGQEGQSLAFVLVVLVLGALGITGFLLYNNTMVTSSSHDAERVLARYAAEAGMTDVITDLIQGEDALDPAYLLPTPTINDYDVTTAVATPVPGTQPPAIYQYVDPGASFGLSSLPSQNHYYFTINNLQPGNPLRVNWEFTPTNQKWHIKLYQGAGPPGAPAPVVIAEDNFESGGWTGGTGWANNWTHTGDSSIVTSDSPYQGTYHMRLRRNTGYAARAVNLSGRTNVRLQFWAKAYSFSAGQTATLSVSPDNVNWTVVRVWQYGEDDNIYRFEDIDLSSFSMTSQFWIAFRANMSGTSDYFWVDTVQVISQAVSAPLAQNSDIKGPGALFVPGTSIAGGVYTLDFMNNSGTELVSAAFSSTGDAGATWIYVQAYEDYVVTSTAGDSSIVAYIRQAPGPTNPTTGQKIYIQSWNEP